MRPARVTLAGLILWQLAASGVFAQDTSAAQPNASNANQRSEEATQKKLEQLACGASKAHFSHQSAKEHEPLPAQPPDKGLVYVIRTTGNFMGAAEGAKLAVDGKWMGVNHIGNYFYFELEPGPHYFCAEAYYRGLLSLVIEKGKAYYLKQEITISGIDLQVVDEERGQKYLAKYRRSIFEEKVKK